MPWSNLARHPLLNRNATPRDVQLSNDTFAGRSLGKYQIVRLLGKGGMGEVYQAWDPQLQRAVAVKILAPEMAHQPEAVRRFMVEARSAARLSHPNIVQVFEIDQRDDLIYSVMEYVSRGSA